MVGLELLRNRSRGSAVIGKVEWRRPGRDSSLGDCRCCWSLEARG